MKTDKKIVTVVAAVICDDMKSPKKIFATQRGCGEFKGGWEFPGGKIEHGETSQEALEREIIEELATKIKVGELIDTVEYNYPELLSLPSSCKSPMEMTGAIIKSYYAEKNNIDPKNIVVVALMPCLAKKREAQREELKNNK